MYEYFDLFMNDSETFIASIVVPIVMIPIVIIVIKYVKGRF